MNRAVVIVLAVVVLLTASGASFYGGMLFGEGRAQSARTAGGRFTGGPPGDSNNNQGGQFGQGLRGGVFGQISEIGDGYLVVTDNNGKQTKVTVTDTTLIEKNASVKLTDLSTGDPVIISGSEGGDGVFTARSVQVAPAGRSGPPGARGTPQTPSP